MVQVYKDSVREISRTSGTGSYSLAGPLPGWFALSDYMTDGDTGYFSINMTGRSGREIILGTYLGSSNILERTSIIESSNAGSEVDWPSEGQRNIIMIRSPSNVLEGIGGGAFTSNLFLVLNASIISGGTGGTPGAQILTGTTGTGTKFQINCTISGGGVVTNLGDIVTGGAYSIPPNDVTGEPVTGGGVSGCILQLYMTIFFG